MQYHYETRGVCSRAIDINLDEATGIIRNVQFTGGCDGNLKAIPRLVDGMTVEQIEEKCKGIHCGFKSTSCADQLACEAREAYEAEKKQK